MQLTDLLFCCAAALLVACGGPQASEPEGPGAANDPAYVIGPEGECHADDECVIAPDEGCCTIFCPTDVGAHRIAYLEAQRERCAVVECSVIERLECPPEVPSPPTRAVCEHGSCVAR